MDSVVEKCSLKKYYKAYCNSLSKGYRQRVGLAQALVHDPKILILDEPTIGLDPLQVVEIRNLISGFGEDHTVVLSTHILSEVEKTCDRLAKKTKLTKADIGRAAMNLGLSELAGTKELSPDSFEDTVHELQDFGF